MAGLVIILAAVGVWHILGAWKEIEPSNNDRVAAMAIQPSPTVKSVRVSSPRETATPTAPTGSMIASTSPASQLGSPAPTVPPSPTAPSDLEREIAITDIKQTRRRGRRGETLVVATIGLVSRSNVEKGDVEIRISFYDVTPNNEIRPTDAQVTYRWLTPVRDWSDPAPKYLAATYLKWSTRYPWFERLRYGGVLVRVYAHGKLQEERAEPQGLLSSLRTHEPREAAGDEDADADVPAPPRVDRSPVQEKNMSPTRPTKLPTISPSPTEKRTNASPTLPYGKPVPGKPGFVSSPYDPKFIIDVRGFPPGTLVNDPNTNKPFRVP